MPLGMLAEMAADAWPDRIAVGPRNPDSGAPALTYGALLRAAQGGSRVLRATGAGSVAFLDVNGPGYATVLFAAALAGIPFCPLNYRLSAGRLAEQLAELADPLIVAGPGYEAVLAGLGRRVRTVQDWEREAAAAEPAGEGPADDSAPCVLLFTSGTSAKPKAAVLRHENLVNYVLQTVEFGAADADDAMLVGVPPYHVAGLSSTLTNIFAGRRQMHLANFSPDGWLRTVRDEGITNAMVVPTMLARIAEYLAGKAADVPTLRNLAYGGARMPATVLEAALAAFPAVDFVNAYGLTETSSTIALLGPADHRSAFASADPAVRRRLSSVGQVIPGVEVQIRDDGGRVLEPGEPGELWLRGSQVSGEYLVGGSVLDDRGWFPTRDRAWVDSDGYLFVEGRSDDTIIRGGENIAPAEVEEVLRDHPGVRDAGVVGVADDEWGQIIVALIVPKAGQEGLAEEEIRAFARRQLRGSRTPDRVVVVPELPYTPTGKLLRRELPALLESEMHNAG
jgi:acyl-CoA synthetase (AMP-forming)/AMP-acid ligase II